MFLLLSPNSLLLQMSCLLAIPALLWACWCAPWRQLIDVPARQHAWCAAILGLALFWLLRVNVLDVLAIHPLAATTLALVFGWHLACIAGAGALMLNALLSERFGLNLPFEFLINVLVPVSSSVLFIRVLERLSARNIFIFMLGGGFVGAMVALLSTLAAAALLLSLSGSGAEWAMLKKYSHVMLLMLFPEGFINGAMVSVLTIFYPSMVRRYDEGSYLKDPGRGV